MLLQPTPRHEPNTNLAVAFTSQVVARRVAQVQQRAANVSVQAGKREYEVCCIVLWQLSALACQ
jgi:hypothetical protein